MGIKIKDSLNNAQLNYLENSPKTSIGNSLSGTQPSHLKLKKIKS
jgi:hypothetical protein